MNRLLNTLLILGLFCCSFCYADDVISSKVDYLQSTQIEIGKFDGANPFPQINIQKQEGHFVFRPKNKPIYSCIQDGEKTKFINSKIEYHYENIEKAMMNGRELEEGLTKETIIIKEKPDSNKLEFEIETQNLKFSYQGPLNKQPNCKHTPQCTATHCICPPGIKNRPENVVGSYAVFYMDDSQLKGRTGKAFHLYRPDIIDSDNKKSWCDLDIDVSKGNLTVIIPQSFLDTAKYPVTIDPIVGHDSVGGSNIGAGKAAVYGWGPYAAGAGGIIRWVRVYMKAGPTPPATEATAGIYDDSTGPDALLKDSGGDIITKALEWKQFNLDSNQAVSNGVDYWLGFQHEDDESCTFYYDTTAGFYWKQDDNVYSSGTLTNPYSQTATYDPYKVSIYTEISTVGSSGWLVDGLYYSLRKKITIQATNVDSDLSDFPLYVKITNDSDMADSDTEGDDIRFTQSDGSTLLKHEKEYWTGGGESNVTADFWVKTDVDNGDPAATDIYIYYRTEDTADGSDVTNVWDANFKGVWHFASDWSDSTSNRHTLIASGGGVTRVTGKIYNGVELLDSSSEYLEVAPWTDITAAPFTLSALGKPTAGNDYAIFSIADKDADADYHMIYFYYTGGTPTSVKARSYDGVTADAATSSAYTEGAWNHTVGTFPATNSRAAFLDGENKGTNATSKGVINIDRLRIGVTADSTPWAYYSGIIDEVRISNIARSDDWIKFEAYNINEGDNELTWGNEESAEAPATAGQVIMVM